MSDTQWNECVTLTDPNPCVTSDEAVDAVCRMATDVMDATGGGLVPEDRLYFMEAEES